MALAIFCQLWSTSAAAARVSSLILATARAAAGEASWNATSILSKDCWMVSAPAFMPACSSATSTVAPMVKELSAMIFSLQRHAPASAFS